MTPTETGLFAVALVALVAALVGWAGFFYVSRENSRLRDALLSVRNTRLR